MKDKGLRFIILLFLSIIWIYLMRRMTAPLDPSLIIDFEFIGTGQDAINFISGLQSSDQLTLMTRSIFLDFIFPLLYGATFYYASAWICSLLPKRHLFNRFTIISSLAILAVLSDLAENMCLLMLIYYPPNDMFAALAYIFAGSKFFLLGMVFIHFVVSGFIVLKDRFLPDQENGIPEN